MYAAAARAWPFTQPGLRRSTDLASCRASSKRPRLAAAAERLLKYTAFLQARAQAAGRQAIRQACNGTAGAKRRLVAEAAGVQ
jgi:hypothetical protein